ncbi:hypothetical protein [Roseospira goensis]|uniref:Catechol 2,3-dioxygenase-like lactoylglutathione lyase family enzyme n=1 Tax=Roseospira goensis TaxID=391922 RepID=A0A7W6S1J4_9PROT|nr:hypothetical protein [Roseospira goensis]MBB4287032.1 catechol 2,3-dioxygenase-like lactoylglutathione lyase family enzyme [Roseospira goensis]
MSAPGAPGRPWTGGDGGDPGGWAVAPVARGSIALFLALYLLLLAFFIMLNALSSLERQRASAVLDSLTLTFSASRDAEEARPGPLPLDDLTGQARAAETVIALVTDLFRADVPSVRVERINPGRAVELALRTEAVFQPGAARLRDRRAAMLDSVVAALAGAPTGRRFEMAVVLQTAPEGDTGPGPGRLPVSGDDLATRRAGVFGATMAARGAAPGSVIVGLAPGDPAWLRLTFRVVDVTRWDPDLGRAPADAVPIDPPPRDPASPAPAAPAQGPQPGREGATMRDQGPPGPGQPGRGTGLGEDAGAAARPLPEQMEP